MRQGYHKQLHNKTIGTNSLRKVLSENATLYLSKMKDLLIFAQKKFVKYCLLTRKRTCYQYDGHWNLKTGQKCSQIHRTHLERCHIDHKTNGNNLKQEKAELCKVKLFMPKGAIFGLGYGPKTVLRPKTFVFYVFLYYVSFTVVRIGVFA